MKRNTHHQIYHRMERVGLIVVMLLLVSSSSALFGQAATDTITTVNEDDATALPLLPPVAWLDRNGITLDEFLQQLHRRVDISVANVGFVQAVGAASPARLQDNDKKPLEIATHNAGATQTLALMQLGNQQVGSSQTPGITVRQAGAQVDLSIGFGPDFAVSLSVGEGIQVKQAGYTREFDLMKLAWP